VYFTHKNGPILRHQENVRGPPNDGSNLTNLQTSDWNL